MRGSQKHSTREVALKSPLLAEKPLTLVTDGERKARFLQDASPDWSTMLQWTAHTHAYADSKNWAPRFIYLIFKKRI